MRAHLSDRNYALNNVTIRVSRDGRTIHGWKWQLLDFFKLQVDRGPERGLSLTKQQAHRQGSAAKDRYRKNLVLMKVAITVDAKKSLPSARVRGGNDWGRRPTPRHQGNHFRTTDVRGHA